MFSLIKMVILARKYRCCRQCQHFDKFVKSAKDCPLFDSELRTEKIWSSSTLFEFCGDEQYFADFLGTRNKQLVMICKNIIKALNRKPERLSSTIVNGRNHQHRATPCDWRAEPLQALQGRQMLHGLTPLQGLHLRVFPFHRALPDANANKALPSVRPLR